MAKVRREYPRKEPAHGFLHMPGSLTPAHAVADAADLLQQVTSYLQYPFNERQAEAFHQSFTNRLFLLWGPPGTGKTTVASGIILGWLERAWANRLPVSIGVGASNYNAIDNVLREVADLLDRRRQQQGDPPLNVRLVQVRSDSAQVPSDNRIEDLARDSEAANTLGRNLLAPVECHVIGGTWMQLGKLAESVTEDEQPVARERDLIVASYAVADRDCVRTEEEFILDPRRFNVTLTRARSKFVMLVSDALIQHLPSDAQVARDAAHLQLFVENYCSSINQPMELWFFDSGVSLPMKCRLQGRR